MRRFQPTLACPFSEATPHRNKPVARPSLGSRDSLALRHERLARMRRAPTRRQSFSFKFLCGQHGRAGLYGGSQSTPNGAALRKRDAFECVWTNSSSDADVIQRLYFFFPEPKLGCHPAVFW